MAIRWVLDLPGVSAVILGSRTTRHIQQSVQAAAAGGGGDKGGDRGEGFCLTEQDKAELAAVLEASPGPLKGEVYGLEREVGGKHARIMKYHLNHGYGGGEHCEELVRRFLDGVFFHFPHEGTKVGKITYRPTSLPTVLPTNSPTHPPT